MDNHQDKLQWSMTVEVRHGRDFGHRLELQTQPIGRVPHYTQLGSWKGLGVPEEVMRSASGLICATFEEHLVTRYGVAGELPLRWSGEPDPF